MAAKPNIKALLAGISLTLGLWTFIRFGYPLVPVPVLLGIALAGRLGRSADWRVGLLNGAVIGLAGSSFRFVIQPNLIHTPAELALMLLFTAALYSVVGVGITKLVASGDSIMW
jgi:hypothetical protein